MGARHRACNTAGGGREADRRPARAGVVFGGGIVLEPELLVVGHPLRILECPAVLEHRHDAREVATIVAPPFRVGVIEIGALAAVEVGTSVGRHRRRAEHHPEDVGGVGRVRIDAGTATSAPRVAPCVRAARVSRRRDRVDRLPTGAAVRREPGGIGRAGLVDDVEAVPVALRALQRDDRRVRRQVGVRRRHESVVVDIRGPQHCGVGAACLLGDTDHDAGDVCGLHVDGHAADAARPFLDEGRASVRREPHPLASADDDVAVRGDAEPRHTLGGADRGRRAGDVTDGPLVDLRPVVVVEDVSASPLEQVAAGECPRAVLLLSDHVDRPLLIG